MPKDAGRDAKRRVLSEHGVRNPNPEAVKDEHFVTNEFFDPLDLVQVKYEMVRRVRKERETVSRAVERFGKSRPSFYDAQRALDEAGIAGLLPKRPGPKGPHKLTKEVVEALEARRVEEPAVKSEALVAFVEERFGLRVHRRSIERALARREKKRRR